MRSGREVQDIIESAAGEAEKNGRFIDAMRLFDLCGIHDRVLQILNGLLAEQLIHAQPSMSKFAEGIAKKYQALHIFQKISGRGIVRTFEQLRELEKFFKYYRENQFDLAMGVMATLRPLIPDSRETIHEAVEHFKSLDPAIKRNFSEILLATMNILKDYYEKRPDARPLVREQSRALIKLVSQLTYQMPTEVFSTLSRIDCLMS